MYQNRRAGFSLVELLVVVAIIAVLIAIILPTLNRAWQQAQWVQCSSNERQILAAMFMYAGDNHGKLPMPPPTAGPLPGQNSFAIWQTAGRGQYDYQNGALWPYVGATDVLTRKRLFSCPADPEPRIYNDGGGTPDAVGWRNFSYSFNYELWTPIVSTRHGPPFGAVLAKISGSEHKILVVEQGEPAYEACDFWGYLFGSQLAPKFIASRHFGCSSAGMADGHVELLDPATVPRVQQSFTIHNPATGQSIGPMPNAGSWFMDNCQLPH